MKSFFKKARFKFVLIGLCLFHLISNLIWLKIDQSPPTWDSAGHLSLVLVFKEILPRALSNNSISDLLYLSNYYPPFMYILGSVILLVTNSNYDPLLSLGTIFQLISFLYIYKIVLHHENQNKKLAILTCIIFSFFPQLWSESRKFHLDIPLTTLLLVTYYQLIKSNQLTSRFHSILFFFFFTCAQITKWYAFVYLIIPVSIELMNWRKSWINNDDRISNILFGLSIFLVGAAPWYFVNIPSILANMLITTTGELDDPKVFYSFEYWTHYINLISTHQITFVSMLILLLGLKNTLAKFNQYWPLLFSILVPYIIFSGIQNKDLRYLIPLSPFFAYIIAKYLIETKGIFFQKFITISYIAYLVCIYLIFSYDQIKIPTPVMKGLTILIGGHEYEFWLENPDHLSNSQINWPVEDILDRVYIEASNKKHGGSFNVLELSEEKYYSLSTFDLLKLDKGYNNLNLVSPIYCLKEMKRDEIETYLSNIDFAIVPNNPGPTGLRNYSCLMSIINYLHSNNNSFFHSFYSVTMPDGNTVDLFSRKN